MLLRSGSHFLPLLLLFPPLVFLQLTYIFQLLIFSLMLPLLSELKTSVSSRVAYLDYHCLLAQWMEVSISVTTAGFTEQTRNSKSRFMAFTAPKVIPASWHELFGWILKKRLQLVSSSRTVRCTKWWLKIQPWVLTETVDNPSCHVFSHFDVSHEVNHVLCWENSKITVKSVVIL